MKSPGNLHFYRIWGITRRGIIYASWYFNQSYQGIIQGNNADTDNIPVNKKSSKRSDSHKCNATFCESFKYLVTDGYSFISACNIKIGNTRYINADVFYILLYRPIQLMLYVYKRLLVIQEAYSLNGLSLTRLGRKSLFGAVWLRRRRESPN